METIFPVITKAVKLAELSFARVSCGRHGVCVRMRWGDAINGENRYRKMIIKEDSNARWCRFYSV